MRLDAPNRLFLVLALASLLLVAYAVCGVVEGMLVPMVLRSVSSEGWRALLSFRLMPALVLLALVGVGLAGAGRVLARQAVASRRLARRAGELSLEAPARLVEASRVVGLGSRVILIRLNAPVAFVHGFVQPRVVISDGLLERLSSEELLAVLEHERYHVLNLDPLKTATLRTIAAALTFVPDLEPFRAQYREGCELAADRRAIAACGTRPLAGALLKAACGPDWADTNCAAPFASRGVLRRRVAQLESGAPPPGQMFSSSRVLLAVLSGIPVIALVATAVVRTSSFNNVTPGGLAAATLLRGLLCAVPVVVGSILAYAVLALKASRLSASSGKPGPLTP